MGEEKGGGSLLSLLSDAYKVEKTLRKVIMFISNKLQYWSVSLFLETKGKTARDTVQYGEFLSQKKVFLAG